VNTLVAMQVAYLFAVRYIHGSSLTARGVLGTPAVLVGLALTASAQVLFTWFAPFAALFDARPLSVMQVASAIAVGAALLLVVELEKLLHGAWRRRQARAQRPGSAA
jgi:magnesium-transporting ATPase (P-type)